MERRFAVRHEELMAEAEGKPESLASVLERLQTARAIARQSTQV